MTDKMRDEFEAWVISKWPETDLGQFNDGEYCGFTLAHCWSAWQASREALVIELPAENPLGTGPGDCGDGRPSFEQHCAAECNFILRDCRKAIEAAGLKVKP
ncbi:hypothetical protein HU742_018185 [Pseudomonas sp. SWRI102]|uniref:Uncharacterized protein n=1 Tax=Pseudomonas marvdashtae TaxID=2745500 RepID=A0A923JQR4_9PSED|nr:hypothetical protein [Pseudomonas marvdashtae]MBV4553077.1 hypothetical protein [Pseudomonas marvdashtae]